MKRSLPTTAILAAALTLAAGPVLAGPKEIELRGTLLCRVDGDPRREKAMDGHFLVIEPDGYPKSAEVLDEAGFFRLKLPASCIDEHVVLKVLRERDEVHLIRVFIERGRLRKFGDHYMYQLGAYGLPGQCQDFVGSQAVALAVRDNLRQGADSLSLTEQHGGGGISKPVVGGVLGAVLSGLGFLVAPSSAEAGPGLGASSKLAAPDMSPGEWPTYAQWSSSLNLGRTLTSTRFPDESAFWNPSSLVGQVGNRLMAAGGQREEYRAAGVYHFPVASEASFLVPRTVSAGFLGFYNSESETRTIDGSRIRTDVYNEDRMVFVGLGFSLASDVGFGVNYSEYHQVFGTTETMLDPGGLAAKPPIQKDTRDIDLSLTWDATDDLRLAAAAYHIGGTEALDESKHDIPLQRGAIGASWMTGNLLIGGEFGLNPGETDASLGLNYRVTDFLALDLSAGSRYETVQGGIDLLRGPFTTRFRIRTDDHEDTALQLGMSFTR